MNTQLQLVSAPYSAFIENSALLKIIRPFLAGMLVWCGATTRPTGANPSAVRVEGGQGAATSAKNRVVLPYSEPTTRFLSKPSALQKQTSKPNALEKEEK